MNATLAQGHWLDAGYPTVVLGATAAKHQGVDGNVGGVGIANVMVISVLERRTEIGVRRALGALITAGYTLAMGWPVDLPIGALTGGVLAALAVGGLAGLYPASRAARPQPAESVR